jgi:Ca2+-binding RTX toxin-like protein
MDFYQSWIDDYGVNGTVVPLASDSSNLVDALNTGIDNLQESLALEISGDDFSLATIGEGVIDGDTITWEVQLEAPLDGSHTGSQIEFVVNDSASSQVGEAIQLNVHTEHNLEGTFANDYLQGHSGDNDLVGAEGDDLLEGLGGNDQLDGGSGNDILVGGDGDDLVSGGQGDDHLSGGDGSDTYAFSANGGEGNDVIHDFDVDTDVIRLADVLDITPEGSTDLADLLHAGDQQVEVTVTGIDVALEISGSQGQTSVTLEGINAAGAFNGDTSLSDLIDSGLVIQQELS